MGKKDYYEILSVKADATDDEVRIGATDSPSCGVKSTSASTSVQCSEGPSRVQVRTAYLKLALKWHPDKHHGNDAATNKFQEISEAYHVLSDPLKRAE